MDLIERQAALDALNHELRCGAVINLCGLEVAYEVIEGLPAAQPEIIRCKGCKWWDKYSDTHGYCLAAKHGYWSEHWDISIRRTYDADWYCADAERRTDG